MSIKIDGKGLRKDKGKVMYSLLPPDALHEVARVFTVGAQKYKKRNWERGMIYSKVFDPMMRHSWKYWAGKTGDAESRCHHLISQDFAPLFESFVAGQDSGGVFVATRHELEEEHGSGSGDGQIPNFINHQERWMSQDLQTLLEASGSLPLLKI